MYIKHRTLQMVHEIEKIQHKKNFKTIALKLMSVGVRRLELPTSTSRTWRAANCATPRAGYYYG